MSLTTAGGVRVTGAWTRAGLGSCVRVEGAEKLDDIIFDCGVCEPECLKAGFVFISHGHVDHIGACVMHARAKMLTSRQSIYYVPTESVGPLDEARVAFSKMDGKDIPMNIVPLKPGDVVKVNSNLIVKVFPTIHRVPSQGYALYKRTNGSLLPQYTHLSGREIGELKKTGVVITSDDIESLELVYTGDTVFEGLIQPCSEFIFNSPILIMELTYLDGERQKSIDRGHIHLQDVVENAHRFNNQQIIFVHLSERYGPHGKALMMLKDGLPSDILTRSLVSLRSFGSGEHLTKIANVDFNKRRADVGWGWGRQIGNGIPTYRKGKVQITQQFNCNIGVNSGNSSSSSSHQGNRVMDNDLSLHYNTVNSSRTVRVNTHSTKNENLFGNHSSSSSSSRSDNNDNSNDNNEINSFATKEILVGQEVNVNLLNKMDEGDDTSIYSHETSYERGRGRGRGSARGNNNYRGRGGRHLSYSFRGRGGRGHTQIN